MSKQSSSIFHKSSSQGNLAQANGRTPVLSRSRSAFKTSAHPRTATPSRTTPGKDENVKPFSTPKCDTPLSHYAKRTAKTTPGKRIFDPEPPKGSKTPFSTHNSKTTKSPFATHNLKTTSKSPSGLKTVTTHSTIHTTPGKSNKLLVEFNDDILITPRGLYSENGDPPTVSVTSTSTVHIETPMSRRKGSPFASPLNRSRSTSSIARSTSSEAPSLKRCFSEAVLSPNASPSSQLSSTPSVKEGESSRVTVGVRVRPLHQREHGNAVFVKGGEVRVASDLGSVHRFSYDHCFTSSGPDDSSQEQVYDTLVKPLVDNAFGGYNACLFAYGQTGSGKTYSMMGSIEGKTEITADTGIIPRFCQELISRVSAHDENGSGDSEKPVTSNIEISYLEVYNEKIHDLLMPGSNALKVREHPVYGPYVVDLTKKPVTTFEDFQHWLDVGNKKRATAATEMNDKSSRSHSLFSVILTQTFVQVGDGGSWSHDHTIRSQINLVDLAGSERIAHTSVSSDRLREGVSINRSLLTLGKVITALVEKRSFVPYRESVLTWLLKDSLGGNSRTTMLATISPSSSHIEESLATLRYASQARSIVNTVRVNEAPQDKIIRELKEEVKRLKEKQNEFERSCTITPVDNKVQEDLFKTKEELLFSKAMLGEATKKITDYSDQIKSFQVEKGDLTDKIKSLEVEKTQLENKAKEYLDNYNILSAKVESEVAEKRLFMTSAEEEMGKILNDYNDLKKECSLAKEQCKQAEFKAKSSEEEVKAFNCKHDLLKTKLEEMKQKYSTCEEEVKAFKNKNDLLKKQLAETERKFENSEKAEDKFESKVDLLKTKLEEMKQKYSTSEEEVKTFKNKHDLLKKQLSETERKFKKSEEAEEEFKNKCNLFKTKLEEMKQKYLTSEEEVKSFKTKHDLLKTKLAEAERKFKSSEEAEDKFKNKYDLLKTKLTETEQKYLTCEEEVKSFKNMNDLLKTKLAEMERKNSEKVENKNDLLNKKLTEMEQKYLTSEKAVENFKNKLKRTESDLKKAKDQTDSVLSEKVSLENKLKSCTEEICDLVSQIESLQDEKKLLKEETKRLQFDMTEVLNATKEKCSKAHIELENHKSEKLSLEQQLKQMTVKYEDSQKITENFKQINKNLKDEVIEKKRLKSDFEELKDKMQIVSELESEISKLKNYIASLKKQLKVKENEVLSLKEKNSSLMAEKVNLESAFQTCKEENSKLSSEIELNIEEKKTMEDKINKFSEESKLLTQDLDFFKTSLAQLEADLEAKDSEVKKLKFSTNKQKTECELIPKLESSMETLKNQVKLLESQVQREKSDKSRLERELEEANSKLKDQEDACDNLRKDVESKESQIVNFEVQLKTSEDLRREVMEEKLTLAKAMEKQCSMGESSESYKAVLSENNRLKRDLNINTQRLEKKMKKVETLNERIVKLEDIMKLILEEKISFRNQKAMLEKALVDKDIRAYDFVMNVSFPHHLEHLTRKARHFAQLYRIPYEFEIHESNSVLVKHLLLSAKVILHHGQFHDWVDKVENAETWDKSFDTNIPWEVDFGDYYTKEIEYPKTLAVVDSANCGKALLLGTKKTRFGFLDPIDWRRMLIRRHVQGIKEDSEVLFKYFTDTEDSSVYSIISRIQASVIRLEEKTQNVFK